jgi:hypothetical protein
VASFAQLPPSRRPLPLPIWQRWLRSRTSSMSPRTCRFDRIGFVHAFLSRHLAGPPANLVALGSFRTLRRGTQMGSFARPRPHREGMGSFGDPATPRAFCGAMGPNNRLNPQSLRIFWFVRSIRALWGDSLGSFARFPARVIRGGPGSRPGLVATGWVDSARNNVGMQTSMFACEY